MTPVRVAIVDDEPPARRRMRRLLGSIEAAQIAGEAASGLAAVQLVNEVHPDLVLLDIQMPDCDGFEVVRRLGEPRPAIIFITAYDEFALRAFELHALDYLLKPFTPERFADAFAHARARLEQARPIALGPLVAHVADARPYLERLSVRRAGRVHVVPISTVTRFDAADNYVTLHTPDGEFLWRQTLNRVETQIDPARFLRVHRSVIVRLDTIVRLDERGRGDYDVVLGGGGRVGLGRTYRSRVFRTLSRQTREGTAEHRINDDLS